MTDTELLEKIVQNTELKTSTQIVVSENSTKIKTTFNPPISWIERESVRWLW